MILAEARLLRLAIRPGQRSTWKYASTRCASWDAQLKDQAKKVKIFRSSSQDPYVNLSIEHYLFQTAPPGSKVLFQYVNRPCIIIGRNQNPWLEVNLALALHPEARRSSILEGKDMGVIDVLRRRSGGGTVLHDEGNVNWSVICDFTEFTRDKHAEMVVHALRELGINRARVNERHDIVLDQGEDSGQGQSDDSHATPFWAANKKPLKVSGSAYKMSGNRALHHGTALLNSPNLSSIGLLLRSPGRGSIQAKGVESVSSPVGNIGIDNDVFKEAVEDAFTKMYHNSEDIPVTPIDAETAIANPKLAKGLEELKSASWTFQQTPEFSFRTDFEFLADNGPSSSYSEFEMTVKNGIIKKCRFSCDPLGGIETSNSVCGALLGKTLHEISNWRQFAEGADTAPPSFYSGIEEVFPPTSSQRGTGL